MFFFNKWDDICFQLIMMVTVMNVEWLAFVIGWLWLYWLTSKYECYTECEAAFFLIFEDMQL